MKEKIAMQLKKLKERTLKDLSKTFSLDEEKKQKFAAVLDSFGEDEVFTVLDFIELIETEISDMINEQEILKKEISDLKTEIEEENVLDEDAEAESEAEVEAVLEEQKDETEVEVTVEDDKKADEEAVAEEKEVKDSTKELENVKNDDVPENVPDFLEQKDETKIIKDEKVTKNAKKTNTQLQGIFNPKKMFE